MKLGKIVSFTIALIFIVFSLTACVGKDTDDTSGPSVNTGETVWTETGNTAQTVNETDTLQRSTTVDGETEKPLSEEPQTAVDPFELLSSAIGKSRISAAKYDLTATDVKYQFFLDSKAVETTLHRANDKIFFQNLGKIELYNGVFNVAVSKDSGKIVSASLTFGETYTDKLDLSGLEIPKILSGIEGSAELKYTVSAVYKF